MLYPLSHHDVIVALAVVVGVRWATSPMGSESNVSKVRPTALMKAVEHTHELMVRWVPMAGSALCTTHPSEIRLHVVNYGLYSATKGGIDSRKVGSRGVSSS